MSESAAQWLQSCCADPEVTSQDSPGANPALVIHCKGGKGRTGTMVCTVLLATGQCQTAGEALNWFATKRTDYTTGSKYQGVGTPSQRRYVHYYDQLRRVPNRKLSHPRLRLVHVTIENLRDLDDIDYWRSYLRVIQRQTHQGNMTGPSPEYRLTCAADSTASACGTNQRSGKELVQLVQLIFRPDSSGKPDNREIRLEGDILAELVLTKNFRRVGCCPIKTQLLPVWKFYFHTAFVEHHQLRLESRELDFQSRRWCPFKEAFTVRMNFESTE